MFAHSPKSASFFSVVEPRNSRNERTTFNITSTVNIRSNPSNCHHGHGDFAKWALASHILQPVPARPLRPIALLSSSSLHRRAIPPCRFCPERQFRDPSVPSDRSQKTAFIEARENHVRIVQASFTSPAAISSIRPCDPRSCNSAKMHARQHLRV